MVSFTGSAGAFVLRMQETIIVAAKATTIMDIEKFLFIVGSFLHLRMCIVAAAGFLLAVEREV